MKKESHKPLIVIALVILAIVAVPFGILSYVLYFAWDSQQSGEFYKAAFEKDGRLYEYKAIANSLAFDTGGTPGDHLYLNTPYLLSELIALGYDDFDVQKTDNPYFAGTIVPRSHPYRESEKKYLSPAEATDVHKYFDRNRNPIFTYEPDAPNEFVVRLRPTFPAFSKSRYSIGRKREYLDATKILKARLDKNLRVRADEKNKLLILKFE